MPLDDLVVPGNVDYSTLWRSDEEARHPPRLRGQRMNDLVPPLYRQLVSLV
ncbi:MAG: hypothetical protein QOI75_6544, partial [Pseudonocardiales bacterium]|nr:hypothetical protein [Pseudonocardiales bacterium]